MGELALIRQFLFSTLFSSFQSTTEPSWVGCPVLAQREVEKRRSPLVHRFRPGGRGFSRHLGVYRPMTSFRSVHSARG